jgi:hypothetical protein
MMMKRWLFFTVIRQNYSWIRFDSKAVVSVTDGNLDSIVKLGVGSKHIGVLEVCLLVIWKTAVLLWFIFDGVYLEC